jgi:trimeric autotransporter adhesin
MASPMVAVKAGVDETPFTNAQSLFSVYPNPTAGNFTLDIKGDSEMGKARVEIFGMRGDKVLSSEISGNGRHELSLAGKPVGVYVIRVISGNKTETARIIKQ